MRAFALVLVLTAPAFATPRTGEVVVQEPESPPDATLYLRTDGGLAPQTRDAIAAAARLLATEPGATLAFALEPHDQSSALLADALMDRSTTARLELLQRLVERNASRWAQRDAIERAMGVPPSALSSTLQLRRLTFERHVPSARARALLIHPRDVSSNARSTLLLASHEAPPTRRFSGSIVGHRLVLPWREPSDGCGPLELVYRYEKNDRVQIALLPQVDPKAKAGVRALARALERLTPAMQVAVAQAACHHPPSTVDDTAALLSAAGVSPVSPDLLDGSPATTPLPPAPPPLLDGVPTTFLEALSLQRPPSLKKRLSSSDPRR